MAPIPCPACGGELIADGNSHRCATCQARFKERALCPDCRHELEVLKACGAVQYFCPECRAVQSRSTLIKEYVAL